MEIQDYLCPKLDSYEQMLYHYLFRQSHFRGSPEILIGLRSLRYKVGLGTGKPGSPPSEEQIRVKIKSLEQKGILKLIQRTREGTTIRVYLPSEIPGCIPKEQENVTPDLESIDFSTDDNRQYILNREQNKCFYCLKQLKPEAYELDHVVPLSKNGDNSYRNLVASCRDCNNSKGHNDADDFIRSLYRRNLLSSDEFNQRLKVIVDLKEGKLIPKILI